MSSIILNEAGRRELLMGNEAIARGAVEAGLQLMAAYPGTPSSEIGETLLAAMPESDFYVEWSTNEKVAFEVGAGASLAGGRTLVAMKNAGLNVAMDTFMTLPYGGVKGGMVVVVADDPDAHYSSNEQDTRFAAAYAEIPCLEPENQQEAKDMAKAAFELSEQLELPVFLRSVSRISHASGDVLLGEVRKERNTIGFNKHYKMPYRWNVYGPPGAVSKHKWLHERLPEAKRLANESPFNTLVKPAAKVGILATGLGGAYAKEALARLGAEGDAALLKLGFVWPFADALAGEFLQGLDTVLVVEEGDPVVENLLRAFAQDAGFAVKIHGKAANSLFPPYGELNTDIVEAAIAPFFGRAARQDAKAAVRERLAGLVIPRSSTLCAGCSHLGSYGALRAVLAEEYPEEAVHIINGDIGCYEQAGYGIFSGERGINADDARAYPPESPYEMLDTLYVMGSGISMAHGQSKLGYKAGKLVAVAGDSTFFHAILPALLNAVYNKSDITFLILDNRWTCMTGHQPNPSTGLDAWGGEYPRTDIPSIVRSMGVESLGIANAYDTASSKEAISAALAFEGPSVVVLEGECQLQQQRRIKKGFAKTYVNLEACVGCKACIHLGCPAVKFNAEEKKSGIDGVLCTDCGLCAQVCPENAIKMRRR